MDDNEQERPPGLGDAGRRWQGFAAELRQRLGPGAPLDPTTRAAFEGVLGGDLASAMVHRGAMAGHVARALGADAVTAGEHVLGPAEKLDPAHVGGSALLGHELAHVVQRARGDVDVDVDGDGDGDDAAGERVALQVERALLAGAPAAAGGASVDREMLADLVYRRMVDELQLERERGAWVP